MFQARAAAPSFCTEQSSPAKDKGHAISTLISILAVVWEGFAGFAPKARVRSTAGCESLGLWGAFWGGSGPVGSSGGWYCMEGAGEPATGPTSGFLQPCLSAPRSKSSSLRYCKYHRFVPQ